MSGDDARGVGGADNRELLQRVEMISEGGEVRRSNPLSNPPAFKELASRLLGIVDRPFDLLVVRDLFGDKVLAYEMALLAEKPVAVSYDREGLISLESGSRLEPGSNALVAADTHFTTQSIQAAASAAERAGLRVVGAAMLLRAVRGDYPFGVWALESFA
jgi:hypothetical protein